MADFLLIHGSCHGAWCWRDVIPALQAQGHSARAIDLPGHGDDGRDPASVTLEETAQAIVKALRPGTLLVGHSWAGFPISAAADLAPNLLGGLIYLCAYVPVGDQSLIDMRKAGPRQTIGNAAIKAADGASYTIDPAEAPRLFYQDCPPEAVEYALSHLRAQPILPQDTPLQLGQTWQDTPKAYIRCTKDQTIPPEYQAQMVADWPRNSVHEMQCSHSPFFADPQGLADLLGHIAKDF